MCQNARQAALTSPLLVSGCSWQWMRVCCTDEAPGGRGAATLAAERVASACAVVSTAFLQPLHSPPLFCRHAHPVIISDAQCGRVHASIGSVLCCQCGGGVQRGRIGFAIKSSEKSVHQAKIFLRGSAPHPGFSLSYRVPGPSIASYGCRQSAR